MMVEEMCKIYGKRLREIRKERGLTVKEFAEGVKMNASQLSELENGKRVLRAPHLRAFRDTYGIDPNDIISE